MRNILNSSYLENKTQNSQPNRPTFIKNHFEDQNQYVKKSFEPNVLRYNSIKPFKL